MRPVGEVEVGIGSKVFETHLTSVPEMVHLEEDARATEHEHIAVLRDDTRDVARVREVRELCVRFVRSVDELETVLAQLDHELTRDRRRDLDRLLKHLVRAGIVAAGEELHRLRAIALARTT